MNMSVARGDFRLITEISIPAQRQRQDLGDLTELAKSIASIGLINPITISAESVLIAGHRRLEACRSLGWTEVPVRVFEQLSKEEQELIELEENVKRKDLSWQEHVNALARIHTLLGGSVEETSKRAGVSQNWVRSVLKVSRALQDGNERVKKAESVKQALNVVERDIERRISNELSTFGSVEAEPRPATLTKSEGESAAEASPPTQSRIESEILCADFLAWISAYGGRKFNLIHCDFPYGIGLHKSRQFDTISREVYADDPEIYFALLDALLEHIDRIAFPSAHLLFWFPMKHYGATLRAFREADLRFDPYPLIWAKSDGQGILPDPERGPRRTYETALLLSRGDRKIIRAVNNHYSAPIARGPSAHPSQKPEPVLRYFFQMLVDDMTEILDPTCGSGTALIAAESLGASRILGLELSQEHVEIARYNVQTARNLREIAR